VDEYAHRRQFFTRENARRIQGCWNTIRNWARQAWLTEEEEAVLIASLINSMDKVANTAGTYYAFLKNWHRKALKPFRFELIEPDRGSERCECFHGPAQAIVEQRPCDVLYLDPPYNARNYARYYHLPETLALGRTPPVDGQAGVPSTMPLRSSFNDARYATTALRVLLEAARFTLLAFHYSDDGLIPREAIRVLLREHGEVEEFSLTSRGYTTEKTPREVNHRLYLVRNG